MYYLKGLPDGKDMLCGFYVSSINEWKLHQPRYLLLSKTAFYRATYSHKSGKVEDSSRGVYVEKLILVLKKLPFLVPFDERAMIALRRSLYRNCGFFFIDDTAWS